MNVPAPRSTRRRAIETTLVVGGLTLLAVFAVRRGDIKQAQVVFFGVLIPSVILHEISHGVVALAFGDTTAKDAGRITLNPISHIDPFGTILLPAIMVFATGSAFGYAKPVPVRVNRLRHPRRDALIVSLAGPFTNFALVGLAMLVFRVLVATGAIEIVRFGQGQFALPHGRLLAEIVLTFGLANVILGVFNLIPIPPLDGSAVLERFIPERYLSAYFQYRQYAMLVFIFLVFSRKNLFGFILEPAIRFWLRYAV